MQSMNCAMAVHEGHELCLALPAGLNCALSVRGPDAVPLSRGCRADKLSVPVPAGQM